MTEENRKRWEENLQRWEAHKKLYKAGQVVKIKSHQEPMVLIKRADRKGYQGVWWEVSLLLHEDLRLEVATDAFERTLSEVEALAWAAN